MQKLATAPAATPAPARPALLRASPVDPLATGIPVSGQPLSQFLNGVKASLLQTHESPTWIQAELAFAQEKARFWSLGLQELSATGEKLASAEAVVWTSDIPKVVERFEATTGQPLRAGLKVLIQVQVSFSEQWGLRLVCKDISPQWTMGEAALQRHQLRQTLAEEGVWFRNQRFSTPADFTHLAVIAPEASAGLEDFLKESKRLETLGLCKFTVFHAPFEGKNAPVEIPKALKAAEALPGIDAICLVRGGGAASGIAWLDHEAIVRAAAKCSRPLLTGIGHERDTPLIEELAALSAGTPSKAIGLVVARITQAAKQAQKNWEELRLGVQTRLQQARQRSDLLMEEVSRQAQSTLNHARQEVDGLAREAMGLGPQATLARGYAMVSTPKGELITSAPAHPNTKALLRFQDGVIPIVLNPKKTSNKNPSND